MFLDDEAEIAKYDLDADEQARRTYNAGPFENITSYTPYYRRLFSLPLVAAVV